MENFFRPTCYYDSGGTYDLLLPHWLFATFPTLRIELAVIRASNVVSYDLAHVVALFFGIPQKLPEAILHF